jgi:hypothetical protein
MKIKKQFMWFAFLKNKLVLQGFVTISTYQFKIFFARILVNRFLLTKFYTNFISEDSVAFLVLPMLVSIL